MTEAERDDSSVDNPIPVAKTSLNSRSKDRWWSSFRQPAFWVNTAISAVALWISIKSCTLGQTEYLEKYDERMMIEGNLSLAGTDSFDYDTTVAGDTIATWLPISTNFVLTNNSRFPVSVQDIHYYHVITDRDSIWYWGQRVRRGTGTKTRPFTLQPAENVEIHDTLRVYFPIYFRAVSRRPHLSPFRGYPRPEWSDLTIDGALTELMVDQLVVPQNRRDLAYKSQEDIDSISNASPMHLLTEVKTSRNNIFSRSNTYLRWTEYPTTRRVSREYAW